MLITQEEPSGKIYWAIGTKEYFANGDPGHLRKALHDCLSLGSSRLWAASAEASLCANWVAMLPRAWSARQLARGLRGRHRGRHTGGCLSSEGGADLPISLRRPEASWGLFCCTPSGSVVIPHKTEQAAIKWCPQMMVSMAGDYLRRG